MKLKIITFNLFALLLSGCCKNCVPHEKIIYPKHTRSGINYVDDTTDLRRVAWWKKLNDPHLNQLIAQALAHNNTIKSAYATMEQAQAKLKAAQFAWIPTLDATAAGFAGGTWDSQVTPRGQLVNNPLFTNLSHAQFKGYYAGFVPGYSVNILNNMFNVKGAKASLATEEAQVQSIKLGIISQVSGTYFMLLSQREQLAVEKALTHDLKRMYQLERVRFKKGASTIEAITSLEQQLAEEEKKIPQIENVIAQSENTIQLLASQNPGGVTTHRDVLSLNANHLIPQSLPSSVLKNRPDIIIALNNVKTAEAQIGMAYSAFFPTISLSSLLGGASLDLTHIVTLSTGIWVAQAAASTKILNASAYQNINAAKAGFKATYYAYLETLHAAFTDVDNALTAEHKNYLSYAHAQKGYLAAKKSYAIALAQYKAGAQDYRKVIHAKINRNRSKLGLIQEKAQLLDSIVQVYNAVAGGYNAYTIV